MATSWACSKCTYHNSNNNNTCDMCQNIKENPASPRSGRKQWACTGCSYLNDVTNRKCEICDTPNLASPDLTKPAPSNEDNPKPIAPIRGKSAARRQSSGYGSAESNPWICWQCKSRNASASVKCNHCSKQRQHWNCYKCTHKNAMSQQKCAVCDATSPLVHQNQPSASIDSIGEKQESETVEELRQLDQKEAKDTADRIVAFCIAHNTSFIDDSFPPNQTSVGDVGRLGNDSRNSVAVPTQWLRPQHIYTRDGRKYRWDVFRDPKPQDIIQGILGNCWFLAALAVVAERPEILANIMITKQYCHQGVYQVRLCIDGRWQIVTVDDYFPCSSNGHLAFSEGRNNQLWVPLIEKALAKAYGSYAALISGKCSEGLSLVTGAPCETIEIKGFGSMMSEADLIAIAHASDQGRDVFDEQLVWARLLSSKDAAFLMGSSCGCKNVHESPPESEFDQVGLVSKHAYSVLDVKDIHGVRLIRLRNPWGRHVWQGDWSEKSPFWTPELNKQLNPYGPERGVFWMPFEQFCRYFDSVDICKFHEKWNELHLEMPMPPNCLPQHIRATRLIVVESGEADLTLHKQGFRATNQTIASKMDLIILIFKEVRNGSVGELVACSARKISSFINLNTVLQPGTYIVVTGAFNHYGLAHIEIPTCMLAMHSSKMLVAEVFQPHPNMIGDALIKMTMAKGKQDRRMQGTVIYSLSTDFCGMILVAENLTQDMILTVDCNCEGSRNVVSQRSTLVTCDVLPPCSVQIMNILTQLETSSPYSLSWQTKYRLSPCNRPLSSIKTFFNTLVNGPEMDPSLEFHQPQIGQEIKGVFNPRFLQH